MLDSSSYASRFLGYLLAKLLARSSANTAAVVRMTVGVTRMNAGTADNVLPDTGAVLFNFRLLPGLCCAVLCCAVLCCAVLCCAGYQVVHSLDCLLTQRIPDWKGTILCLSSQAVSTDLLSVPRSLQTLGSGPRLHNKLDDCTRTLVMTVRLFARRAASLYQLSVCAEVPGPDHCRPFPGLSSAVLAEAPVKSGRQGQVAASWGPEGSGSNARLISLQ